MDIDWIMQGTLAKEISQKKAIMEEKAVAIKRVKMGSQKVFRELAMEMVMSKVEIIEGLTNRAARKQRVFLEEACSLIRFGPELK